MQIMVNNATNLDLDERIDKKFVDSDSIIEAST